MTQPTVSSVASRPEPPSPRSAPQRPPGPAPRGSSPLAKLRYGLPFLLDPIGFVGGRFQRYGDTYFVGSEDPREPGLYVLRHPDQLEEVLVTKARSFAKQHSAFDVLSKVLGEGLLTADGDVWRRQRRLLQPAFAKARLDEYAAAMVAEASAEADRWRDGEVREVTTDMMDMTLRIVCRTLFGYDSSGDAVAVRRAMDTLQGSLAGLRIPLPPRISPAHWRLERARRDLDRIIYGIIDSRRRGEAHADLLQRLVDAEDEDGSTLTREQIRDQLVTLFLAGHETTSNALSWTFHLLAENPDVEARFHAELDDVLGGRLPSADDLPRLVYADQVFTEAMRLYPPVTVLARKAIEDVEVGGWAVPAGSELVMWVWHTQRDPRFYDEPWAFRPERFEKERVKARPKLAYLPFGAGPRACIGKVFAQMEGVLALAAIGSRWRLVGTGGSVDMRHGVTLAPKALPMRVVRR